MLNECKFSDFFGLRSAYSVASCILEQRFPHTFQTFHTSSISGSLVLNSPSSVVKRTSKLWAWKRLVTLPSRISFFASSREISFGKVLIAHCSHSFSVQHDGTFSGFLTCSLFQEDKLKADSSSGALHLCSG